MRYNKKQVLIGFLGLLVASTMTVDAKQRTTAQMQQIAAGFFNSNTNLRRLKAKAELREIVRDSAFSVWGSAAAPGFVIVSADDNLPEVLGYSTTAYQGSADNANFNWWLSAVRESVSHATMPVKVTKPGNGVASKVEAMVTCHWGQGTPYNYLCPLGPHYDANGQPDGREYERSLTGCAATAIAQIMYYHKYPTKGRGGEVSVGVPYNNPTATYTVDFDKATYDWANMTDDYKDGYSEEQANAVATLMYHAGVALDMQYSPDASGTYARKVVTALKRNFGYPETVRLLMRSDYTEPEWMNLIYTELSEGRPIQYNGQDAINGGHAFVFDGYDADGLVHVNWGWEGDKDGYYDVSLLNPTGWHFTSNQSMVIGIARRSNDGDTLEVDNDQAGGLGQLIPEGKRLTTAKLTVRGKVNGSDLAIIRYMAGRDQDGKPTKGNLASLDLSQALMVGGGEAFLNGLSMERDNELPQQAFYGCDRLEQIVLPANISHIGNGAFALCYSLDSVGLTTPANSDYVYDGAAFLSKDSTQLIAVLPSVEGSYSIPNNVSIVNDFAFAGCTQINKVVLPRNLARMGDKVFCYDYLLNTIKSYAREAPQLGSNCFDGVDLTNTKLLVWHGCSSSYEKSEAWKAFIGENSTCIEFGTTVKANNASRIYGNENPKLSYKMEGTWVEGLPVLTCAATPQSSVGVYPIKVERGSITGEDVEFEDGQLNVKKAALTVTPADTTREAGQENPEFRIIYFGWKNNENKQVLTSVPTVTTDADVASPAGVYTLYASGGEADNYKFVYKEGKLTVTPSTGISSVKTGERQNRKIYSLDGKLVATEKDGNPRLPHGVYIIHGKKIVIE